MLGLGVLRDRGRQLLSFASETSDAGNSVHTTVHVNVNTTVTHTATQYSGLEMLEVFHDMERASIAMKRGLEVLSRLTDTTRDNKKLQRLLDSLDTMIKDNQRGEIIQSVRSSIQGAKPEVDVRLIEAQALVLQHKFESPIELMRALRDKILAKIAAQPQQEQAQATGQHGEELDQPLLLGESDKSDGDAG